MAYFNGFLKYDQNDMIIIKGNIKDRETVCMHMDMIRAGSLTQPNRTHDDTIFHFLCVIML